MGAIILTCPLVSVAADAWDVEGSNGVLYIYGALAESACRLEMDSARQDIVMGEIGTGHLLNVGEQGTPVGFQIRLRDCLRSSSIRDERTGSAFQAYEQPSVTVTFRGEKDADNPELIGVRGVSGMGLRIVDAQRRSVRLGSRGVPLILDRGQNALSFTVAPERTSAPLVAGSYRSVVDFNLSYD
ncbi:type 1 fimbrial protein [Enterobacter sp. WCHEn045836]|nr:fimbrial protein [Enterobacter sp. WCHEn045836]RTP97308.1 type 1 fimbrial protein [Enterobacter sp. WCHEn045836]